MRLHGCSLRFKVTELRLEIRRSVRELFQPHLKIVALSRSRNADECLPAGHERSNFVCHLLRGCLGCISKRLRSEEHKSELQSLMRTSSAVLCLKNKKQHKDTKK